MRGYIYMAKMNFRARAKTLRRKMSDLAFDQSGDAGTPEDRSESVV